MKKKRFVIDSFEQCPILAKDKDPIAPPERYYDYCKGNLEDIIIETYEQDGLRLSFAHLVSNKYQGELYYDRKYYLENNGFNLNSRLIRYTVPPKMYKETLKEFGF